MPVEANPHAKYGFRQVGPIKGGLLDAWRVRDVLQSAGGYEIRSDTWIRRFERSKKGPPFVSPVSAVATISAMPNYERLDLGFLDAVGMWPHPNLAGGYEDAQHLCGRLNDEKERWRGVNLMNAALLCANANQIPYLLTHDLLPRFFSCYPEGRICVARIEISSLAALTAMRCVYAAAFESLDELRDLGVNSFPTLKNWQWFDASNITQNMLDVVNYMFTPYVVGYVGGRIGLLFEFLFDPPEEYNPGPFPPNWHAIPRSRSDFGMQVVRGSEGESIPDLDSEMSRKLVHRRFLHKRVFSADDRSKLANWVIEKTGRLFYELTDPANFTQDGQPGKPIDPTFAFEHLLTVGRLIRRTTSLVSQEEVIAAKTMAFEIADLYDTLYVRHRQGGDTNFFRLLFNPVEAKKALLPRLRLLPHPFGEYLADVADECYTELHDTIIASVWNRSKVTSNGVLVRKADLSSETLRPSPDFVSSVMRAYRNAHHGYFTDGDKQKRPSRFLYLVDGDVPDCIASLPSLWILAFLADTSLVGWEHLPINHYPI